MVVLTILVVAVSIFSRIVVATSRLREINRENAVAGEAARVLVEQMRGEEFSRIFALYNADPNDDPDGVGTAPGDRFEVRGLEPPAGAEDGRGGSIIFPTIETSQVPLAAGVGVSPEGGNAGGATGGGISGGGTKWSPAGALLLPMALAPPWTSIVTPLREDCVYPLLGMPRDLNGDSIVDQDDHAADYLILPVQIHIEWEGRTGLRAIDLFTMLTRFKKDA